MISVLKVGFVALISAAALCPLCESDQAVAATSAITVASDTATARLHISGMTCGTCPTTARVALKRVRGVFNAKVTLADSLGVVQYARVSAKQIAEQLTKLTGYGVVILSDTIERAAGSRRG